MDGKKEVTSPIGCMCFVCCCGAIGHHIISGKSFALRYLASPKKGEREERWWEDIGIGRRKDGGK